MQNWNSSRFGKYTELQCGPGFAVRAARSYHYLLEKTRVVMQAPNERNFHVFYYFLAGAPDEAMGGLGLARSTVPYAYLNGGWTPALQETEVAAGSSDIIQELCRHDVVYL